MTIYEIEGVPAPQVSSSWHKTGSRFESHIYVLQSHSDAEDFEALVRLDPDSQSLTAIKVDVQPNGKQYNVQLVWKVDAKAQHDASRQQLARNGIKIGVSP